MTWALALLACGGPDAPEPGEAPIAAAAPPVADAGADLVGTVGEPVLFDAGSSAGVALRWTFGDGASGEGASTAHTYEGPGHYTAILEVTGADGTVATDGLVVTVVYAPMATTPTAASPLALADGLLYAAMPDFDAVAVVDAATRTVVRHLETCARPRTVAVAAEIAVACEADAVHVLDPTGAVLLDAPLDHGSRPWGALWSEGDLWVTAQGRGELLRFVDGRTLEVEPGLPDLRGLAAWEGGLLASRWRSPDAGGELLYRPEGPVEVWTLPVDPGPDSDTNARGVPSLLQPIAVRPDGRVAYVGGLKANIERGLARDGLPLTFETTVRADLRSVSLDGAEGPVGEQLGAALFDDRDIVGALALSELGDWLFVAHRGMETVDVLDAFTLGRAGAIPDVGHGVDGLVVDGETLWVLATLSRELVAYDISDLTFPAELARIDLVPSSGEVRDPTELHGEVVFGRSADLRMTAAGYVSCSSCHPDGDHDGRTWDFTDRGEGLRNTISLLGRAGADPIHWSANFDEVQDFEHDIRGPQQGRGFLEDADWAGTDDPLGAPKAGRSEDLDALAAYVESLRSVPASAHRDPDGSNTALATLGEQVFLDPTVGCATCHPPPTYTDSQWLAPAVPLLHDVGTLTPDSGGRLGGALDGLDTPSLRGLSGTGPYLHDGSAPTLRDVLVDRNAEDRHGTTSHLAGSDLDALERFLLELE